MPSITLQAIKSFFSSTDTATRMTQQGQENNLLTFILDSNNTDSPSVHKHNTHTTTDRTVTW
jgi:hypothetical protein